jgi:hypothetical protein
MGSISFSTDFDGVGSGSGFSINTFTYHGPNFEHSSSGFGERSHSDTSTSSPDSAYQDFLRRRYDEQVREAKQREEEEERRKQAERARRLGNLRDLQSQLEDWEQKENSESRQQMKYTQDVLVLEKKFEQARKQYLEMIPSYRERLEESINHIMVPPPSPPLRYDSILIRGTTNTPDDALIRTLKGTLNPFTGKNFNQVFGFALSDTITNIELIRVVLDHYLSSFNSLSPETMSQLGQLKGATARQVVVWSNGYRVALALIATGQPAGER